MLGQRAGGASPTQQLLRVMKRPGSQAGARAERFRAQVGCCDATLLIRFDKGC